MEFSYESKIPKERIAVLLGVKGNTKKAIERELEIKITVNSKTGDIVLEGDDSLKLYAAQNIIKAIGRGFNPEIAMELLEENNSFDIIEITDYVGNSDKNLIRARARSIGTEGKARKYIEQLTDTNVMIHGKTISIIGHYENVDIARKAFESLLNGSRHSTVYAWLEKQRKKLKYKMY